MGIPGQAGSNRNKEELDVYKRQVYEYLDLFLVWFRDVLMFKATKEVDGLVFLSLIHI